MGTDDQGLGLIVGNTADSQMPVHAGKFFIKFGTERSVLNVVDSAVEPVLIVVDGHACPPCSQMGVIVSAEKQIENTVFF